MLGVGLSQRARDRMEFSLTAERHEPREATAAFARPKLIKHPAKAEESGEILLKAWQACASPLLLETGVVESLSLGGGRE